MILIKNTQRTVPINRIQTKQYVQHCLDLLNYSDFDIGIWFTSAKTMQQYNELYRHKNKPTDILSFAYHTDVKAGQRITVRNSEDRNLGDLIICPAYIQEQLPELGITFEERLNYLLVHGICHLLGYDHEQEEDYQQMHLLEKQLLNALTKQHFTQRIKQ